MSGTAHAGPLTAVWGIVKLSNFGREIESAGKEKIFECMISLSADDLEIHGCDIILISLCISLTKPSRDKKNRGESLRAWIVWASGGRSGKYAKCPACLCRKKRRKEGKKMNSFPLSVVAIHGWKPEEIFVQENIGWSVRCCWDTIVKECN